ncbi:hypothetical protein D3C75_622780 [compost metagenome]
MPAALDKGNGQTVPGAPDTAHESRVCQPPFPAARKPLVLHEKNADQRDSTRRVACCPGRRPTSVRPRHRIGRSPAEKGQHLQGPHHPRRAQPRGCLRRLRRRSSRLPAAERNLPRVLQQDPRGSRQHQGRAPRRPGSHRSGREGRAWQQGRSPDHLHQPGRPLSGSDAQQPARRRHLPAHRGRGTQRTARSPQRPQRPGRHGPDRAYRRPRPFQRRAAVGPRLPGAAVDRDQGSLPGPRRTFPDLPGKQRHHPRHPRLPAPGHR